MNAGVSFKLNETWTGNSHPVHYDAGSEAAEGTKRMRKETSLKRTESYCDHSGWHGRWAKAKGMPRSYGHVKGCANLENSL